MSQNEERKAEGLLDAEAGVKEGQRMDREE
jgi:hypothetical protein